MAYVTNISDSVLPAEEGVMNPQIEAGFLDLRQLATDSLRKRKPTYDFKTRNKSFLQLYTDLNKIGVKNNCFFLRIYDRDLIGVDPYAMKNPPVELQIKIFMECMINPWYYLREICRIVQDGVPTGPGLGVPYRIDRNNAACWYLFLNGIDTYQSKPRQQGKTQDNVARFLYSFLFGAISSNILFFNKDAEYAIMNLDRLKNQRACLPEWLQMRMVTLEDGKIDKGTNNVKTISNPINGNKIMVMGSGLNKEAANKLGRGATAALQYYDEFDFMPFNTVVTNAAVFAYKTAAENAKKHRSIHGRCMSSTPGDLSTRDGATAADYINDMVKWKDEYFDIKVSELRDIVRTAKNPVVYVEHSWKQLRLSMKWYEEQCHAVRFDEEQILREINLQRIHGNDQSPFKRSSIIYITTHKKEILRSVDYSNKLCPFNIYEKLYRNYPYIMSIDPAEGLSQDNNAMTLINPYTLKPAAEFKSPYISQFEMYKITEKFLDEFCPKAMIVIESNRGRELIGHFTRSRYRYQVYYDDNKLMKAPVENRDKYGAVRQAASERRAFGFTTGSNRHDLYAIVENFMEERLDMICTDYLVEDTAGLIRKPNGRIEAGAGSHDDNIMSYLIGLYVYYNAPADLLERWDIRRGMSEPNMEEKRGPVPEKDQLQTMRDLLPSLPPELQQMVQETLQQKTTLSASMEYQRQIELALSDPDDPYNVGGDPRRSHTTSELPTDDAFWGQYDQQIIESNFSHGDDAVDINSFLNY